MGGGGDKKWPILALHNLWTAPCLKNSTIFCRLIPPGLQTGFAGFLEKSTRSGMFYTCSIFFSVLNMEAAGELCVRTRGIGAFSCLTDPKEN